MAEIAEEIAGCVIDGIQDTLLLAHNGNELIKCWLSIVLNEAGQITWDGVVFN